jgi:GMP synthase-like glutamine amidotransferase
VTISVLQHAAYEGPGEIAVWATSHGHALHIHHLYRQDLLPRSDEFDLLVVMGGEMNIYQYRDYPWLREESVLIQAAMQQGKRVIGICLGAQLIADALGSRVFQNAEYELGWFPVDFTAEGRVAYPGLPDRATVLHWHGDTFALPPGASRLASSPGCLEQGFMIKNKCLGLQIHLETDPTLVHEFVKGQAGWPSGRYTQKPETILSAAPKYHESNRRLLHGLLDVFFS